LASRALIMSAIVFLPHMYDFDLSDGGL